MLPGASQVLAGNGKEAARGDFFSAPEAQQKAAPGISPGWGVKGRFSPGRGGGGSFAPAGAPVGAGPFPRAHARG